MIPHISNFKSSIISIPNLLKRKLNSFHVCTREPKYYTKKSKKNFIVDTSLILKKDTMFSFLHQLCSAAGKSLHSRATMSLLFWRCPNRSVVRFRFFACLFWYKFFYFWFVNIEGITTVGRPVDTSSVYLFTS